MPKKSLKRLILIMLVVSIIPLGVFLINRGVMPAVTTIADQRSVAIINDIINNSLISIIDQLSLESTDFFQMTQDGDGHLSSLSVDTMLLNMVASQLAVDISSKLSTSETIPIPVPLGLLTGIPIFASMGPNISINIIPTGQATVEYETSFISAGINQINFQAWLYVETEMRIVVPLQETSISVSRRVPLVNTVFAGVVPEGMLLTNFGLN